MNFKLAYIFIFLISIGLFSFQIPNNVKKKVTKEIKTAFEVATFSLEAVTISDKENQALPLKITGKNLYKVIVQHNTIGYAFIDKAPSKTDQFDYLVLFDKNLIIKKAKILIYREDYGGEIGSKRWLKQFIGKKESDTLRYKKDIIAISGATISATSMTKAVNTLLKTIAILHQNHTI